MPQILLLECADLLPDLGGRLPADWTVASARLPDTRAEWAPALHGADLCVVDAARLGARELEALLDGPAAPALIALAGFGSPAGREVLLERGCADVLELPVPADVLQQALTKALRARALLRENRALRDALAAPTSYGGLLTRDPGLQAVFRTLQSVADTRACLLFEGESGTGKTELARAVHQHSTRASGPFVELDCGALPEALLEGELFGHARGAFTGAVRERAGRFEAADGGTLFLDEIASASPALQVKLLRVLESGRLERLGETRTRQVDVRLLCATNRPLSAEVRAGRFREDLYFRIHVVALAVPPLRERVGDVPLLIAHYLERFRALHARGPREVDAEALAWFAGHGWPGNVRELAHLVERAVLLCNGTTLGLADARALLPRDPASAAASAAQPAQFDELPLGPLKQALAIPERRLLLRALEACGGNRERAAVLLGINRATLFHKLRKHGIRKCA
jgi:DNA-binding NtrC family response regulator